MKRRLSLRPLIFATCLVSGITLLAPPTSAADRKDEKKEATDLLARATQVSNIRADGAPPFIMRATFRLGNESTGETGAYSETWISKDKWRREVVIGKLRRLEIADGRKKWILDQDLNPGTFTALESILKMDSPGKDANAKGVKTREVAGIQATCARFDSRFQKEFYCAAPTDGTLLAREVDWFGRKSSTSYTDYQKFGDYLFPRAVHDVHSERDPLVISVSQLSAEVPSDSSLFSPPPGSVELGNCDRNVMTYPKVEHQPDLQFPENAHAAKALVLLSLIVGTDKKPHMIHVVRTGGAEFDIEAIRAVQTWTFSPAMCHGEPVSIMINVEVQFHR